MKCGISLEDHFYGTATVGDRGQVVIPADARKKCDIHPGDKVLVMSHPAGHGLIMFKIDAMREMFSALLADLERIESRAVEPEETVSAA